MSSSISIREEIRWYEDLPDFAAIDARVLDMLGADTIDLEEVVALIARHLVAHYSAGKALDEEALEDLSYDAFDTAHSCIEDVIRNLRPSPKNAAALKDFIWGWDSFVAYDTLLMEMGAFLSDDDFRKIREKGKRNFVPEITEHWPAAR